VDPMTFVCPVCGYDGLIEPAWDGKNASDEICPSCGTQFGYHDASGGSAAGREAIYSRRRNQWIEQGMPWHSLAAEPPPNNWDPGSQLQRVVGP